jgi:hypothetical protein
MRSARYGTNTSVVMPSSQEKTTKIPSAFQAKRPAPSLAAPVVRMNE